MVEVHFNMGIGNVEHGAHDAHAVGCHHGECGSLAHHFAVKLAVDVEHIFFKFGNIFVRTFAECFVGSCLYVEGFAIGLAFDVFFEGCDKAAGDAVDEAFGMLVVGLMHELLRAVCVHFIEVVGQLHIFSRFNFFHNKYNFTNGITKTMPECSRLT